MKWTKQSKKSGTTGGGEPHAIEPGGVSHVLSALIAAAIPYLPEARILLILGGMSRVRNDSLLKFAVKWRFVAALAAMVMAVGLAAPSASATVASSAGVFAVSTSVAFVVPSAGVLAVSAVGAQGQVQTATRVEREHFIFYFDQPRYIDLADTALMRARQQLLQLVGDTLNYKANVYLVDEVGKFQALVRGRIPDWGAAVAYPPRGLIAVKSPDKFNLGKSLAQLLTHEYSHLVLAQRTGFYEAPRWFDEGLAQRVSTEWSWLDNLAMSKAAVFGQYIPLDEIEMMNRFNESRVQVAYAQSHVAVNYFYDAYGPGGVNAFLDAVREGVSYDEAFMRSTGSKYAGFEQEFQDYWSSRFNLITLLADMMWLWFLLAIVVIIGAFLRYRKRRSYYKKWERQERLESTDFDYGDPENPEQVDDDEPWRS